LAVTLAWRLPATGQALAAGFTDAYRARLIADATSVLSEEDARRVEERVLHCAGRRTYADLRERLAREMIAVDPEGAERRRQAAERLADVRLYTDDDQTATISASKLPQVQAAAGFARLDALASARKAAGLPGSLGFHRSQVLLGMMHDTLPYIPPAEGAPADQPSPGDDGPEDDDPGTGADSGPAGDGGLGSVGPADDDGHGGSGPAGDGLDGAVGPANDDPARSHPGPDGPDGPRSPEEGGPGDRDPGDSHPGGSVDDAPAEDGPGDGLPAPRDEDAPPDDGLDAPEHDAALSWDPAEEDDDPYGAGPAPAWPALGVIPPALARRDPGRPADWRPVPGLLDVTLPWTPCADWVKSPRRWAGSARLPG
jgi:hypothetical protein